MPDVRARLQLLSNILSKEPSAISEKDLQKFATSLEGYSAADITALVKEAAMEAIREFKGDKMLILSTAKGSIRAICKKDLDKAARNVQPSLDKKTLTYYLDWERKFKNMQ